MPRLNDIITYINTGVKSVLNTERFQAGKFYGQVVELIPEITKESRTTKPVIVDFFGDATEVIIDDTLPLQVYHRNTSLTHNAIPDNDNFGDPGQVIGETANMLMIVISDRSKILMQPVDLLAAIIANIPQTVSKSVLSSINLLSAQIEFESTNTDMEEVYKNEYNVENYGLKPNSIMYAVQYKITTTFSKGCFPVCS